MVRAAAHFGVEATMVAADSVADWATSHGLTTLVTGHAPTGLTARQLAMLTPALTAAGVTLVPLRREWDTIAWPAATAGFFKVKSRIPQLIAALP
jgi:deoxyribodipyrimidine photo-lyase